MRFEGKGVVVTGAAQGIGRAVAKAFAAEGAGLVIVVEGDVRMGIDDARGKKFAASIDNGGGRRCVYILTYGCDLSVLDVDAAILNIAVCHCHHDRIPDQDFVMRGWRTGLLRP